MESRTRLLFSGGTGHRFSVMRVSAFHHSNRVASCSFDGTVRIWNDLSQEDVLFSFSEAIESLEVTPDDNKIIFVLANSSKAFIFDLTTKNLLEIGRGKVFRALFGTNPTSTTTGLITFEDELYFYDHSSQILSSPVYIENISGDSLIWINENSICIPRRNGSIAVVDKNTRSLINEYQLHEGLVSSIWKDGEEIVTVSEDGTGKIFDHQFNPVSGFKVPFTPQSVCYSKKSNLIVVSGDRNLMFVERSTGSIELTHQELTGCNPAISKNSVVYRGTGENNITLYSEKGEALNIINGRTKTAEDVEFLNSSSLVYASGDRYLHRFEFMNGEDESLVAHSESVSSVVYNPDAEVIIAGSFDDSVSIWDLKNRNEIKRIKNVPLVTSLSLSPDFSSFGVACSADNSIHVFNKKGELISRWDAHDDFISTVHFLNDEILVSGSDDESLRFWKLNGKLISKINVFSPIKSIATNPEFDYIIVGLENGELIILEKISNKKISNYSLADRIQCIEIVNDSILLIASQNILYKMELDGPNIITCDEITRHTEPIRGIYWDSTQDKVISVDHSVEILETQFFDSDETILIGESDEDTSTTVIFAPNDEKETTQAVAGQMDDSFQSQDSLQSGKVVKIIEYLTTVSFQLSESVSPKLDKMDISTDVLRQALTDVISKLEMKAKDQVSNEEKLDEKGNTKSEQDWRSFDWGKRKD